jgi:large repetitive protein
MFTTLILATMGAATAGSFSESDAYGSFTIPFDGTEVTLTTTLHVTDLDPYVGGRLEVNNATLDLTFYDLDIDPDIYTQTVNGCACNAELTEFGDVTIDGVYAGELTDGADNDYATTSLSLDSLALAELETDGEIDIEIVLAASLYDPCGLSLSNAPEVLSDVTISGDFDDNHAPTAIVIAADEDADSTCSATVTLDGTTSFDADSTGSVSDIVSYEWDIDGDGTTDHTGDLVDVVLDVGDHDVTLTVTDTYGESSSETVTVTVNESAIDHTVVVSPSVLTPADHTMRDISYDLESTYVCSGTTVKDVIWALVDANSSEADDAPGPHDGSTTGDVDLAATGELALRAERSWRNSGRTYTLDFEVYGDGGVIVESPTAEVTVPKSASGCSTTGSAGVGLLSGMVALLGLAIRRRED